MEGRFPPCRKKTKDHYGKGKNRMNSWCSIKTGSLYVNWWFNVDANMHVNFLVLSTGRAQSSDNLVVMSIPSIQILVLNTISH